MSDFIGEVPDIVNIDSVADDVGGFALFSVWEPTEMRVAGDVMTAWLVRVVAVVVLAFALAEILCIATLYLIVSSVSEDDFQ